MLTSLLTFLYRGRAIKILSTQFNCSMQSQLMEGTCYEAWQTSKEQTKMATFTLEGPLQCTIFCFALMNYVTNTFLLVSSSARSKQLLCFVRRQGLKRE